MLVTIKVLSYARVKFETRRSEMRICGGVQTGDTRQLEGTAPVRGMGRWRLCFLAEPVPPMSTKALSHSLTKKSC